MPDNELMEKIADRAVNEFRYMFMETKVLSREEKRDYLRHFMRVYLAEMAVAVSQECREHMKH